MNRLAGAGDKHVQPASAAGSRERAKAPMKAAAAVRAISCADNDVVALVPLHIFEVFDEQSFE